jgi:DNA-binding NarL/FixJ family response regulator
MIRVLIADDESLVRGGFAMILGAHDDIEVVGEATDGAEAVELAKSLRPDVVLMDIRMPGIDGLQATKRLLTDVPSPPRVLILTTFDLDEYVYEAMKVGASAFLLKTAPANQLAEAVRAVARGDALLSPVITKRLIEEYVRRPPPGETVPPRFDSLTDRELEVLRLVATGLSNAEIAESLYVSDTTVKTHVNRLLSKLGLRDRVQAVVLAYESGFVSPGSQHAN